MANEQNLIPWNRRTESEQREYARKGGQKSGEVRRQRKAMKEQAELLLALPFNIIDKQGNELKKILENLGIDENNIDNQMAMIVALWRTALGNGRNQVTAVQELRDIIGEKAEKEATVQRVEIINDLPQEEDENATS